MCARMCERETSPSGSSRTDTARHQKTQACRPQGVDGNRGAESRPGSSPIVAKTLSPHVLGNATTKFGRTFLSRPRSPRVDTVRKHSKPGSAAASLGPRLGTHPGCLGVPVGCPWTHEDGTGHGALEDLLSILQIWSLRPGHCQLPLQEGRSTGEMGPNLGTLQ